jgi:FMN reductase [NAD(P)H]
MTDLKSLLADRFGLDTGADAALNPTIETILKHRSIRSYQDKDVDEGLLDVLLACAQSAPAKSNLQQYSIIVVRDADRRARIAELVPSLAPWFITAPVFLCFLGDVRRIRRLAEMRGHDYENDNADTFMNACVDAALAMQNFITAAESDGLGCCPISMIRNHIETFADILELPDGVFPVAGLTLGWPDWEGIAAVRLPPAIAVHRETYDDTALEAEIAGYDDRAHERKPIKAGGQRHIDLYGELEKCTWSENVARQLSRPERAGFAAFLKKRGIELK